MDRNTAVHDKNHDSKNLYPMGPFPTGTIILLACITSRSGTLDKHCASQRVAMLPGELITIKSTSSIVQKILILFSDLPQEKDHQN